MPSDDKWRKNTIELYRDATILLFEGCSLTSLDEIRKSKFPKNKNGENCHTLFIL